MQDQHDTATIDLFAQVATINEPAQPITSVNLHEAAQLVFLHISVPSLTKLDKGASAEVTSNKNAERGSARVNKSLINKSHLKEAEEIKSEARNYMYKVTRVWSDSGFRLLTNAMYLEFAAKMQEYHDNLMAAAVRFADKWETLVAGAALELGDLYNPNDYPTREEILRKFSFRLEYDPVPRPDSFEASNDVRLSITETARKEQARLQQKTFEERINRLAEDVWRKLYTPLKNMSERLDYDDEGKPRNGHFKGTLVDNVLEIVEVMRVFNLNQDPQMDRVCRELRNALTGVTVDGLKASDVLRRKTKAEVDNILKTLPTLDW